MAKGGAGRQGMTPTQWLLERDILEMEFRCGCHTWSTNGLKVGTTIYNSIAVEHLDLAEGKGK